MMNGNAFDNEQGGFSVTNRRWKVVITDYEYPDLRFEEETLRRLGDNVTLVKAQCRTEDEVIAAAFDADAIMSQYAPVSGNVIDRLEKCKIVSRYGVGYDVVDVRRATEKGICVANVPDYCMDEVSDHAMALLLAWARKIPQYDRRVKQGVWDYKTETPIFRMRNQTLGLIGFGRIPRAFAGKARTFGLRVLVHDPYVSDDAVLQAGCQPAALQELLRESDYVSVHTPLTDDTRGMMNRGLFRQMKPSALFINTSRGPVVREEDLIEALRQGWIAGAALDVVEREPISPDHPLLKMDNVILTPHVAWYSEQSEAEMRTKCAMNVVDVLQGRYPAYLVNPQVKEIAKLREIGG